MVTLYGISTSRAFRPRWLLEELQLEYQQEPVDFRGDDLRDPAYLALNPNGRVPTLVDGETVLWESMAINLYLAEKYGREAGFWPEDIEARGKTLQWSFWVMTEVEHALLSVLMHRRVLPEDKRDSERAARNEGCLKRPFGILDQALAGREYLVDDHFTVADLNLAAVLCWVRPARYSLEAWPDLDAWLTRCLARPARKRAQV